MIPTAVTAPFRWWAKHPWIVFWGTILFCFGIFFFPLEAPHLPSVFVIKTIVLPLYIVLILSFIRGMFLMMWKRSKGEVSKFDVIMLVMLIAAPTWLAVEVLSTRQPLGYVLEARLQLRAAAQAQESYFAKNNSFKSCVACTSKDLPKFYHDPNVTLNSETGSTSFALTATHARCGDIQWTYQSTTGEITGPSRDDACK